MGQCTFCRTRADAISRELGVCLACIRRMPMEARRQASAAHQRSRAVFGLPVSPPRDPNGVFCKICVHECSIPEKERGYCGLRKNKGGKISEVSASRGKLSWYHDPLPTNCVGDWVCAGGTGAGYPQYAYRAGPETGYRNLAVFFHSCSFNCLYCQNWHFKQEGRKPGTRPVEELLADIDETTTCICYFGGDPAPQLPFSLKAARLARKKRKGTILRVCWETNGSMHPRLADRMTEMALASGGCIKFDLKAWDDTLHRVLTDVTNQRTWENFARVGEKIMARPRPPLLIANTLLVPGYIDAAEISAIARFIAAIHPDIPYSLLAFHPQFQMADLPLTSKRLAAQCVAAARQAGLRNVRLGNTHLLV